MSQCKNIIVLGKDNDVVINFSESLSTYAKVEVTLGTETYNSVDNPSNVIIQDKDLILRVGDTTTLTEGKYPISILGFSVDKDDGEILSNTYYNPLPKVIIRT